MFETAELGLKVSKEEYKAQVPELRTRLLEMQYDLRTANFPVLILVSGVDGAGKGDTVNLLHEWMDPRYLITHGFGELSEEERERPPFWRFWRALPPKGRIGIFFGSWYTEPIVSRVHGTIRDARLGEMIRRIQLLETELVADGMLLIKLWFHLSKAAQAKRLKRLAADKEQRWRVTAQDWRNFELYDTFRAVSERVLRETSTGDAPWIVIEGRNDEYRNLTVGRTLHELISKRLAAASETAAPPAAASRPAPAKKAPKAASGAAAVETAASPPAKAAPRTILDTLDLSLSLTKEEYARQLEECQGRLNLLQRQAREQRLTTVLVFEGVDAAGKGGAIRRVTAALDARDFTIVPIAAPTDEERAHHYLWRFWRHLPRAGRVIIFDRSWYGRVLVERVEGFAKEAEWRRAYAEINGFEAQLVDSGIAIAKFWLHIDPEEQLRRFRERENTPFKQYKITEEDWRNRERWDAYVEAVNEMVERTSTEYAPWTLVEANDKSWARIKVLSTICQAMKKRL